MRTVVKSEVIVDNDRETYLGRFPYDSLANSWITLLSSYNLIPCYAKPISLENGVLYWYSSNLDRITVYSTKLPVGIELDSKDCAENSLMCELFANRYNRPLPIEMLGKYEPTVDFMSYVDNWCKNGNLPSVGSRWYFKAKVLGMRSILCITLAETTTCVFKSLSASLDWLPYGKHKKVIEMLLKEDRECKRE